MEKYKCRFKIGDKVTTPYHSLDSKAIRTITKIEKTNVCGSGYRIWADAGEPCPFCGKTAGRLLIDGIDGAWFNPTTEEQRAPLSITLEAENEGKV